jgi:myosin heavy subunit
LCSCISNIAKKVVATASTKACNITNQPAYTETPPLSLRVLHVLFLQDMTDLVFLHEPGVLHNLKQRYSNNAIYTYTGSILIAVNPFKSLPGALAGASTVLRSQQQQQQHQHQHQKQALWCAHLSW